MRLGSTAGRFSEGLENDIQALNICSRYSYAGETTFAYGKALYL